MNSPNQRFRRFLIGTIAVSSVLIAIVLFTSRSNVPGQQVVSPLNGVNQTTGEAFVTQLPFYFDQFEFDSTDTVVVTIPIEKQSDWQQPALLIERPLHFIEVHWNGTPLTPSLDNKKGARAILVPFESATVGQLQIFVSGDFGRGGIAENVYLGDLADFQHYIQLRTASAILVFAILIFTTVSLLLLVFIRPNYQRLLSTAAFFFGLTMVSLSGVELWYLISDSVYYQVRLKTFSIYLSIAMALQVVSSFSQISSEKTRLGTVCLTGGALLSLVLPSMSQVQTIREVAYWLSVPFSTVSLLYAIRYYKQSGPDTKVFFWICGILLIGGVLDLMSVFKVINLPPSMPIASALFAVIATVLLFIRSSDLATRYRTLVEHSTDAILILNDQFIVIELNEQAEQFGLQRAHPFSATIATPSSTIDRHINCKDPIVELSLHDPSLLFESISIQLQNDLTMIVLRNITERKRAESQLLTKTRFETANLIASSVAHDFSNLMMAIEGQVSILGKHVEESQHSRLSKVEHLLDQGTLSIRRIQNIVQTDFSVAMEIEPNQIIQGLLDISRQSILNDIQMHFQPKGGQQAIRFNPEAFEQVLFNLMLNAKDALANVGDPKIWIDNDSQADCFVLHIEDSGQGIPDEIVEQIFDPFVTNKAPHLGSGLGLTVAQRLVRDNGGELTITAPKYGNGAAFLLTLPLLLNRTPKTSDHNAEASILVLEDEPLILDVLEEILTEAGYTVYPHQTIETAEWCISDKGVDLLISDVILNSETIEDGFDFANRMVEQHQSMNILMMSGYIPDNITDFPVGWSFLQKPFQRDALLERIEEILHCS